MAGSWRYLASISVHHCPLSDPNYGTIDINFIIAIFIVEWHSVHKCLVVQNEGAYVTLQPFSATIRRYNTPLTHCTFCFVNRRWIEVPTTRDIRRNLLFLWLIPRLFGTVSISCASLQYLLIWWHLVFWLVSGSLGAAAVFTIRLNCGFTLRYVCPLSSSSRRRKSDDGSRP